MHSKGHDVRQLELPGSQPLPRSGARGRVSGLVKLQILNSWETVSGVWVAGLALGVVGKEEPATCSTAQSQARAFFGKAGLAQSLGLACYRTLKLGAKEPKVQDPDFKDR